MQVLGIDKIVSQVLDSRPSISLSDSRSLPKVYPGNFVKVELKNQGS